MSWIQEVESSFFPHISKINSVRSGLLVNAKFAGSKLGGNFALEIFCDEHAHRKVLWVRNREGVLVDT